MKNTLCVIVVMLLFGGACNKGNNEPEFPRPSQTGENYVACKIDGKPYIFKGKPVGLDPTGVSYYYGLLGAGLPSYPITRAFSISGNDIGRLKAEVYCEFKNDTSYRIPLNQKIFIEKDSQSQQFSVSVRTDDYRDVYYYALPGSG